MIFAGLVGKNQGQKLPVCRWLKASRRRFKNIPEKYSSRPKLVIKNVSSGGVIEITNRSTAEKVEVHPQNSHTLLPNHIIQFDRNGTIEHGYLYLLRESNYSDEPVESSVQEPIKQRNELTTPQKRKFKGKLKIKTKIHGKTFIV